MGERRGTWQPKTKTQANMLRQYRSWSPQRRMAKAVELVLTEKGMTQAQASRDLGVSPSRLSEHVKAAREKRAAADARAAVYADERAGTAVPTAGPLDDQRTRVGGIRDFVRRYFGGLQCWDCHVHHEVPEYHFEMLEAATDPSIKRLMVNLPPGHAKSWNLTTLSTVYEIVKDRNSMTGIVSAGSDLAAAFVGQIANLLTVPELYENSAGNLIDDFGPFRDTDSAWTADFFYVSRRTSHEKDPTVKAYGIGSRLYGPRLHRMILDDVADTDNQVNPDQIAKQLLKITREADSRVGNNGKLIIAGTRVQPGDLYTHLLQLEGYTRIRYPVIVDANAQLTLWPEHFDFAAAQKKRKDLTPEGFELIWQNSELPSVGAAFTRDQLEKCHDPDRILGEVPPNVQILLGLDLAGSGPQSGYTALVCLALDRQTSKRYLIDIVNQRQMRPAQLKAQLLEWAERYKPYALVVEQNGLQQQLVQNNEDLLFPLAERGVRVTGHQTHGKASRGGKWDDEWGVASMGPMVHNTQLSLPWGMDANTRRKVGMLEDQMVQFPSKTVPQDILMALWFAELSARDAWQAQLISAFDPRTTKKWPPRILNKRKVISFGEGVRTPTNAEVQGYSMWSPNAPPERFRTIRSFGQDVLVSEDA